MSPRSIRVRVFGATSVRVDGRPVHLTGNMRRMLCLIASAGPHGISIDQALTEAVDGDSSPKAQSRVRMDVSRLRKRIGADLLPNASGMWRLEIDPSSVDYFSLQQWTSASELPSSPTLASLLTGRPFHDGAPTPLVSNAIRSTNAARLDVLRRMLSQPELITTETLVASRELLDDDPLNEELIEIVVDHHLAADQTTNAREILFTAAISFHELLGVDLPDRLRSFEETVGSIRPSLPGTGTPGHSATPTIGRPLIVGREAEEDSAVTWLELNDDTPLLVTGPSGSGKTTLLHALVDEAQAQGIAVVLGIGREFDNRPYTTITSALSPRFRELATDRASQQSEIWSAALEELVDHGSPRTLLVIDDAQWLDSLTRDLVLFLIRSKSDRLSIVLSGRPTSQGLWESLDGHARASGGSLITLDGLDPNQIEQIIIELRPGTRISIRRRLADEVHRASNGLPAIAVRLIELAKGPTLDINPTPSDHGLGWFVEALPRGSRHVGLVAAVLGHRMSYPEVAGLADLSHEELLLTLEALTEGGVLLPDQAPGYVSFAHALVREAFLEQADPEELHSLRRRAAETTNDPHRRAQLLDRAGPHINPNTVADALRVSAELHLANGALTEAVQAYERADNLDAASDSTELAQWAGAVDRLGLDGAPLRHRAFERAMAEGSLEAALSAAVSGLPQAEQPAGDPERIALLEEIDSSLLRGRARFVHAATLARQHAVAGHSALSLTFNSLAATLAESDEDLDAVARSKWLASCAITSPQQRLASDFYPSFSGEVPPGIRLLQAIDQLGTGHLDEARQARDAIEAALSPASDPMVFWHTKMFESTILSSAGKREDARSLSDEAFEFGLRYGIREAPAAWMAQIFVDRWMCEPDGAAAFLEEMATMQPVEVDDSFLSQAALALALHQIGDSAQATPLAEHLTTLALVHESFAGTATLTMCARVLGDDHPLASAIYEALLPLAESLVVVGGGFVCVGPADLPLALVSTGDRRAAHLRAAWQTIDRPELAGWLPLLEREAASITT